MFYCTFKYISNCTVIHESLLLALWYLRKISTKQVMHFYTLWQRSTLMKAMAWKVKYKLKSCLCATILFSLKTAITVCSHKVFDLSDILLCRCFQPFYQMYFPEILNISAKIWSEGLWATGCCAVIKTHPTCCAPPPLMAHVAAWAQTTSFSLFSYTIYLQFVRTCI